jgi:prepilin-type N-terminal cleavage/methylation domain-containing protein
MQTGLTAANSTRSSENGFTLIEVLVSIMILMIVSATALDGIMNLSKNTRTVANRTEMHAGVRNATELLQQEVGQAGRVVLPSGITLAAAVAVDATTFTVSDVTGMWIGQYLTIDTGGNVDCNSNGKCAETVRVQQINGNTITIETNDEISKGHIAFWWAHDAGAPISIAGAFWLRRGPEKRRERVGRLSPEDLWRYRRQWKHDLHRVLVRCEWGQPLSA